MPFCRNCGAPVEGQFCAKCGTPLEAGGAPAAGQPSSQPGGQATAPAATGMADNVAGLLCYVLGFITGVLFLVIAPYNQNKFVRFHAFQSIFFSLGLLLLWIAYSIVAMILTTISPIGMGLLMSLIALIVWVGTLIVWIMLMVKAYQNQKWVLPIIGPLAEKQA